MLPPGFVSVIAQHIRAYGEAVEFVPNEPPGQPAIAVRALVQRPGQSVLIGDAVQESLVVWIAPDDLPMAPVRFDRLVFAGQTHAIEEAHAHRAGGAIIAWEARCAG